MFIPDFFFTRIDTKRGYDKITWPMCLLGAPVANPSRMVLVVYTIHVESAPLLSSYLTKTSKILLETYGSGICPLIGICIKACSVFNE